MDSQKLFEIWAAAGSVWSRWAKPVLFASTSPPPPSAPPGPEANAPPGAVRLDLRLDFEAAYVVDLPGAGSVGAGLELARAGCQPVPLYNTAPHPAAVIEVETVLEALAALAPELAGLDVPAEAPPAFLLDSRRLAPASAAAPGRFDNRWVVFPQDFPSASFLLSRGLRRVILVQEGAAAPAADLAHVLLRYAQAGIEILLASPDLAAAPRPLEVRRPSRFRSLFYRALTLAGLRRNSAGGFGAVVPLAAAGGGYG